MAEPAVMLKVALVAPVSPVAVEVRVYPVPDLSIERLLNVATPPEAATVTVPDNVPPPALVPIAMVIEFVAELTVLPCAS